MSGNSPDLPCAEHPDVWFSKAPANLAYAKAWCNHCPISTACLAGAFERKEEYGIFGGMTAEERQKFQRRADARRREQELLARPFKQPA
jgi:hypothetical protein